MSTHPQLQAESRDTIGKKVRTLRRTGVLPATVYGPNVAPQTVQVNARDFSLVLREAGRTQLIDLTVDGKTVPVLVKQLAVNAKRNQIQHIEFYKPNLRRIMHSIVRVHTTGESPAVKEGGILLVVLDHIEVESLPDDVPAEGVVVDISQITEINGQIHVSDLTLPSNVTILTPGDEVVVKVAPPVAEEEVEEVATDDVEAAAPSGQESKSEGAPSA